MKRAIHKQTGAGHVYPINSLHFWRAYFITMRPYLLFVSGSAALVGMAFIEEPQGIRIVIAFIPLFLSYGLGQSVTDCFQTDTDALSSPYRPLVKGTISKNQVLFVSLTGLLLSVIVLAYLNPVILIFGILSVVGLLSYTFFKKLWWGGPPWNAWIVALLPVIGCYVDPNYSLLQMGSLGDGTSNALPFLLSILAIFFAYANFVVMGYFKDISADRETGYSTFPVVYGWKPAAIYSDVTALLALLLTGGVILLSGTLNAWSMGIFVVAGGLNIWAQIGIHNTRDERQTHGPIENVVRAFILYCLAIITAYQTNWLLWIIGFYLLFELALYLRPEKSQI